MASSFRENGIKNPVKCCIFDMDGLLLDTENLYSEAYQLVLDPFGKKYDYEFKTKLMGKPPSVGYRMMVENYELPFDADEFQTRVEHEYDRLFPTANFMPGIMPLLQHLKKSNIPMAVATSSGEKAFALKMKKHSKFFTIFHHVVKGCDPEVINGKPAPDIFQVALKRFKMDLKPEECLAFEDSLSGVKAAKAAGMQVLMIPDPKLKKELTTEADYILDSAKSFRPTQFGLPAYPFKPIVTHVLFDMDGLLLDTTRMYRRATEKILKMNGKVSDPEFRVKIMGRRHQESIPMIIQKYDLPYNQKEFSKIFYGELKHLWAEVSILEGVERFVRHLHKHNIPIAVATSSQMKNVKQKIAKFTEFFDLFHHFVTGDDPEIKHGKPAPDIFQICARRFDPPADCANCLVLEDAPNGVSAATKAGMQSVLIPTRTNLVPADVTLKATMLLQSMSEIKPEDFGLPAFD